MNETKNISEIVKIKLCNTCGACAGVCPVNAIHYEESIGGYYFPIVAESLCTQCGLCCRVCPGWYFGKTLMKKMPDKPFEGVALASYVGKATDKQLFDNSQSGGVVSAILVSALETGIIRGAVTVYMQMGNPPRPRIRIAQNKDDVFLAQKSKYCPVPLLKIIKELEDYDGKIAIVGTSCQIHGLYNVLDKKKKIREKIAFCIGLFCEKVLTYAAIDYFLYKAKMENGVNTGIIFKDKLLTGYPGDVHLFTDYMSTFISSRRRIQIKPYFTPARCRICFDKMNVFSDISVGDPHGLKNIDKRNGESAIIIRTKTGEDVLDQVLKNKAISIRSADYQNILDGQLISNKKQEWRGYTEAWSLSGRNLPSFSEYLKKWTKYPVKANRFNKDLAQSFALDNYTSGYELIRQVDSSIKKNKIKKILFKPYILVEKLKKKLLGLFAIK